MTFVLAHVVEHHGLIDWPSFAIGIVVSLAALLVWGIASQIPTDREKHDSR